MEQIVEGISLENLEILKSFLAKYIFGGLGLFAIIKITSVIIHNKKQRKLQTDQFEKELFEKFNSKFDKLNGNLNKILNLTNEIKDKSLEEVRDEYPFGSSNYKKYHSTLMDYFNLCAEEYYWHKKDRISEELWNAWFVGMNYYYNESSIIREYWAEEIKGDGYISYYLKKGDNLFKEKIVESAKS